MKYYEKKIKKKSLENKYLRILVEIVNFIILTFNIYFLCDEIKRNDQFNLNLRNSDQFIFFLLANSYSKIGNYLNSKYNLVILKDKKRKKIISLHAVNLFNEQLFKQYLLWHLKDKFIIKFNEENPDYLVYNIISLFYPQF